MEGWQVVTAIGGVLFGAAMLRLLWVAAFSSRETVTPVRELDGYVPGTRSSRSDQAPGRESEDRDPHEGAVILEFRTGPRRIDDRDRSEEIGAQGATVEPFVRRNEDVVALPGGSDAAAPGDGVPGEGERGDEDDDRGGVWIELDIEPLFPSSDGSPTWLVDLTEENEPEATL